MKRVVAAMTAVAMACGMSIGMMGCDEILGAAVVTIRNNSSDSNITEVHIKGPGNADFGGNVITAQIAPGGVVELDLDAPQEFEDEVGVTYQIRVKYEILDIFQPEDVGTFNCIQAGDEFTYAWTPGATPEVCVD